MFGRPKGGKPTRHLFVGNCGPGVGIDRQALQVVFGEFGKATVILPEAQQNPRSAFIFVTFGCEAEATAALAALNGKPCASTGGRTFNIKYADLKQDQDATPQHVALSTDGCKVQGLTLLEDFVSEEEEKVLLACSEQAAWETLARRRVCHFGYKFEYQSRNVDPQQPTQPFPAAVQAIIHRLHAISEMPQVDQCTVNEYPAGVGLSPHIDTHSAFSGPVVFGLELSPYMCGLPVLGAVKAPISPAPISSLHAGAIASLSLAGPAVMEFRQTGESHAIFLPPRCLLVMAGPARYCWQHYIPHRKADHVQGAMLPRAPRRVSFTFRQVRGFPCTCPWPEHCDTQQSSLPPTRMAQKSDQSQPAAPTLSHQLKSVQLQPADKASWQPSSASAKSPNSFQSASGPSDQPTQPIEQSPRGRDPEPSAARGLEPCDAVGGQYQVEARQYGSQPRGTEHGTEADLQRLEQEFVHDVYNAIAPHFSATRFAIWPKVRQFIEGLPAGSLVADVGCGNGKYFMVRQDIAVLGSDRSTGLAQVAATRLAAGTAAASGSLFKADVAVADGMCLPYASNRFDAVLSIAVLHHITTPSRRIHMLTELLRILRPGGQALVTVWATHQEDMNKLAKWQPIDQPGRSQQSHPPDPTHHSTAESKPAAGEVSSAFHGLHSEGQPKNPRSKSSASSEAEEVATAQPNSVCEQFGKAEPGRCSQGEGAGNDYFVPWHLPFHRAEAALHVLKAEQEHDKAASSAAGSIRIDNKKNAVVFSRYYHVYEQFELDQLVQFVPEAEVLNSFYDKDNWCVVMGKRT